MPPTPLTRFLDGDKDGKTEKEREGRKVLESGKPFTLWDFNNKHKWYIDQDELPTFYKLYFQDYDNSVPLFFTEKCTAVGQLRVDLDFKYDGRVETHKHTQDQVIKFVQAYMNVVKAIWRFRMSMSKCISWRRTIRPTTPRRRCRHRAFIYRFRR
jgi:hypothetical protein